MNTYDHHIVADMVGSHFVVSPVPSKGSYAERIVMRATDRVRELNLGRGTRVEFDVIVSRGEMANVEVYSVENGE